MKSWCFLFHDLWDHKYIHSSSSKYNEIKNIFRNKLKEENFSEHDIKDIEIIIYGKNCSDKTVLNKYNQLNSLGFTNVGIYIGGIFEWLLLQDIYGNENFPTTIKEIDILKYK